LFFLARVRVRTQESRDTTVIKFWIIRRSNVKAGPRVVLAVGVGYFLGRTRKMRLALMIAAAGATGKAGGARQLLQRGLRGLADSPEFGQIADSLRGELLTAAKSAAATVATSRVKSLNSRLQDAKIPGQRDSDDEDYAEPDDQDVDELDEDYEEEEESKPTRRSRSGNGSVRSRSAAGRSPVRRGRR
jgi:hypothetical protein